MLTSNDATQGTKVKTIQIPALARVVSNRTVAIEAVTVAMAVAAATVILAPDDLAMGLHPHPAWAAVILLSARYCGRGFAFAMLAVWGSLTLTALVLGLGIGPLGSMSSSAPDLVALAVAVVVSWVASAHERHIRDLSAGVTKLQRQKAEAGAVVSALKGAALALRARVDRVDHSVTFMRDVATRLSSGDPVVASQAALELALARTGARAGVVQLVNGRRLRTVASAGAWTLQQASPPDVFADITIQAAFETGSIRRATDLDEASTEDSDVAFPIANGKSPLHGVLALRGVPSDSLEAAPLHDVALIASWCGQASAQGRAEELANLVPVAVGKDPRAAQFAWDAPTLPAMRLT